MKAILLSITINFVTIIVSVIVAVATAHILAMSEERGAMAWYARPYFLIPLYVCPTLAVTWIILKFFHEKISSSLLGTRGMIINLDRCSLLYHKLKLYINNFGSIVIYIFSSIL